MLSADPTVPGEGDPTETTSEMVNGAGHSRSPGLSVTNPDALEDKDDTPSRPPTSAEIDAVIAAAMANAPPPPSSEQSLDAPNRSITPLMTNLLPAAVGADGRVNLFVGNLPYRVRWQDLKDLFRKAGTVLRADVSLGQDNRSRGYGTVLMGSREDAARAIDRFNGYTWQTRTLEVRPDRLPPEYEAQGHAPLPPHPAARVPMFPFVGTNHFGGPGHPGPGWHPPNHHRPPMHFGPHHPMAGAMSHPGMSLSPHPMATGGSAPGMAPGQIGRTHSPAPHHLGPNGMQLPMSSQNTGPQGYAYMSASPLAGSLTTGADILPRPASSSSNHLGVSPQTNNLALPRAPSPAHIPGTSSRSNSSQGHRSVSPGEGAHHLPPQAAMSTVPHPQQSFAQNQHLPLDLLNPSRHNPDHGHMPHLEGLAHRSNILGPPNTLHDRVVFVSNLPLTMQWQELKDLLRPAGLIIRADVASSPDGRPRGFGTALFGAVQDAARAVSLFNGRELGGRRIRVYLERDSHHHDARRSSHSQTDLSAAGSESANGQTSEADDVPAATTDLSTPLQAKPTLASRVPWHLNLTSQSTPPRSTANGIDATPHFRSGFPNTRNGESTPHFRNVPHPEHIAMPPWPSLDTSNPLSPLQTRGLPPMTPSMPGFVFNNAYPDTPPVPHHFMGPFSPGLPVTSPTGFAYNPFLNAAPGAPVNRGPQQTGGSAQLGTPTTQAFPHNSIRGAGPPGAPVSNDDYFPSTESPNHPQVTPPSLGARTVSQSVLNARDRLAPTGPDMPVTDVHNLAASMALQSLATGQETPPSPTIDKRNLRRSDSGADLGAIGSGSGTNGASLLAEAGRTGRFSLDDQRPNLDIDPATERRASFGDSRK